MNRCEQVEFDIEEMKDEVIIQHFELVAMKHRMDSLELKIDILINKTSDHQVYGEELR